MKNRQERIEELVYISNPSPYDSNRYYPGAVVVAEQKLAKKALVIIKQLQEENKKLKERFEIIGRSSKVFYDNFKAKAETLKRVCQNCGASIEHKHINARSCSQKCKDKYHNRFNPRGYGAIKLDVDPHNSDDASWECDREGEKDF